MDFWRRAKHRIEKLKETPATIECKGCGRAIDVSSLTFWSQFICRSCKKPMRLARPLYTFHYTDRRRRVMRNLNITACLIIALGSMIWAWNLIDQHGFPPTVSYVGLGGSGILLAAVIWFLRTNTEDYRLTAGIILPLLALRRVAFYYWADLYHIPVVKVWGVIYFNFVLAVFLLLTSAWQRWKIPSL